jgi:hypothetical protein
MDLLTQLTSAPSQGPFGALRTDDASEPVTHAAVVKALTDAQQGLVNRTWSGRMEKCLLYRADTHEILLVEHRPTGFARAGHAYGYSIRTVTLPAPVKAWRTIGRNLVERFRTFRPPLLLLGLVPVLVLGGLMALGQHFAVTRTAAGPPPKVDSTSRQAQLDRREANLISREATLKKAKADLDRHVAALEKQERNAALHEAALAKAQSELASRKTAVAKREHVVTLREGAVERREAGAATREDAVAHAETAVAHREAAVKKAQDDVAARWRQLEQVIQEFGARLRQKGPATERPAFKR